MGKYAELRALPSEVVLEDSSRHVLQELPDEEKEHFYQKLKTNLEEQLKYGDNPIF